MSGVMHQACFAWRGSGSKAAAAVGAILCLANCATTPTAASSPSTAIPSHVYARPLDDALLRTKALLLEKGWRVQTSGGSLATNWRAVNQPGPRSEEAPVSQLATSGPRGDLIAYQVEGERVDDGYCTLRVVRVVATSSALYFGQKKGGHQVAHSADAEGVNPTAVHHGSSYAFEDSDVFQIEEFKDESPDESGIRTDAPNGMVVSARQRDEKLELEIQERIEPPVVVVEEIPAKGGLAIAGPKGAFVDGAPPAPPAQAVNPVRPRDAEAPAGVVPAPVAEGHPSALAGIWNGTFTFRGTVTGSFSGEVTVAVEGDSVEVDDFCPENGGTLNMRGSSNSAVWQGKLACSPIKMRACPSATVTYDFVRAALNAGTLTVAANGTVDSDSRCHDPTGDDLMHPGGPFSVAFVARRADYVHIAVTKAKREAVCVWPRDWEDFSSEGSMAMPEPQPGEAGYLGIIRAKGNRLTEIQRLLRHCRHVVSFQGQSVSMKLAVTRSDK